MRDKTKKLGYKPEQEGGQEDDSWNGRRMRNRAMCRKLQSGRAIDLGRYPHIGEEFPRCHPIVDLTADRDVVARIESQEPPDLCLAYSETWIWSVCRHAESGRVWASGSMSLCQEPGWQAIWLR